MTTTDTGCIGIQGAPVDVRQLLVPCTGKPNRECCGHRLCALHYRHHKAGVHPPQWKRGTERAHDVRNLLPLRRRGPPIDHGEYPARLVR